MRWTLTLITLFIGLAAFAQPKIDYTSSNKKAIKLYESGLEAYNHRLNEAAVDFLTQATVKDPEFVEAYILMSQAQNELKDVPAAISSLEKGMSINPRFFPNGFYFLGELYLIEGNYEKAKPNFTQFIETGKGKNETNMRSHLALKNCEFAIHAMANPVDFTPVNLGPGVNSEHPEYYPCLTADEQTLLYTRVIPDGRSLQGKQEDFFVSELEAGVWNDAEGIREINSAMNEGAPSLSHDGQVLIFTACEVNGEWGFGRTGLGSCDLFFSQKVGTTWRKPLNLGEKINSYYWESQPSIAADGTTLYFVRGKSTARGVQEQDIWVSKLSSGGVWQKATKVEGYVNTAFEEESVLIHPDGETMYFSSNGHVGMGGLDIYMSKIQPDGSWGEPTNLGYPINTHGNENSLLVGATGELAFFASDREGGFGDLDLYSFILPEEFRPKRVTYMRGVVFDALSYKKLEAKFEVIDLESGRVVCESYSNGKTGEFMVSLPVDKDYALSASREGYLFFSGNFSLKGLNDIEEHEMEVPMEKIKPGGKVVLNNIFFETASYQLRDQSAIELDKLVEFLILNRNTRIEIGGHTDNVGAEEDNLILSENRASEVVDYLISNGIETYRLVAKGYGEESPISDNDTDKGRALNRRTEFMVIE